MVMDGWYTYTMRKIAQSSADSSSSFKSQVDYRRWVLERQGGGWESHQQRVISIKSILIVINRGVMIRTHWLKKLLFEDYNNILDSKIINTT